MPIINLKVNKDLLDVNFESYKLSLDPIPVLKQSVVDGVENVEFGSDEYSFMHTKMIAGHNCLFGDLWCQNSVFYINQKQNIIWTSLGKDGRLTSTRCVWNISNDMSNTSTVTTISFPGADWAVVCSGKTEMHILYTPSRDAGEPWMLCHTHFLETCSPCVLLHSVHRTLPGAQLIDCVVATVKKKSDLPEHAHFSESCNFVSVLEWISFNCGQNHQVWTKKRCRKLAGMSWPEYAAIDTVGDALCVVSQSELHCIFDSEGLVNVTNGIAEKVSDRTPKYTYIQTTEDICVYFRLPEGMKKSDIQIHFSPRRLEVVVQGQVTVSGDLANCVDHESCTWILDGDKLEVVLNKAERGLMWQELLKGDAEGEEIMDAALVEEVHARLAHLTSDTESTPSDRVPFNLQQLEECDSSTEQLIFQRIDGNDHSETHRAFLGGHPWLFSVRTSPDSLPSFCLRHDVDGLLWEPLNVSVEGEADPFRLVHASAFPALGYVSASKRDARFAACAPDARFAVIADCRRHLYVYRQPESLGAALELRNRRTGQAVSRLAKQHVIALEDCARILGMRASKDCIFALSADTLFAAKMADE